MHIFKYSLQFYNIIKYLKYLALFFIIHIFTIENHFFCTINFTIKISIYVIWLTWNSIGII